MPLLGFFVGIAALCFVEYARPKSKSKPKPKSNSRVMPLDGQSPEEKRDQQPGLVDRFERDGFVASHDIEAELLTPGTLTMLRDMLDNLSHDDWTPNERGGVAKSCNWTMEAHKTDAGACFGPEQVPLELHLFVKDLLLVLPRGRYTIGVSFYDELALLTPPGASAYKVKPLGFHQDRYFFPNDYVFVMVLANAGVVGPCAALKVGRQTPGHSVAVLVLMEGRAGSGYLINETDGELVHARGSFEVLFQKGLGFIGRRKVIVNFKTQE